MPPVARTCTIPPPTPELLTESFCERCGTRYTFESAAPKSRRPGLGRARILTRGIKNWVVEDGRSIEAAMADARRDEERGVASAQLEAFHQTFNFCMDCRQYTCTDCWNQAEGRCLSCAPMPGQLEAEAAAAAQLAELAAVSPTEAVTDGAPATLAWPTVDLAAESVEAPPAATVTEPASAGAASAAVDEATVVVRPYMPTDLRPVELPEDELETIAGADEIAVAAAIDQPVPPPADIADGAVEAEADQDRVDLLEAAAAAASIVEPDEAVSRAAEPLESADTTPETAEAPPVAALAVEAEEPATEAAVTPVAAEVEPAPEASPAPTQGKPTVQAWTMVAPDSTPDQPAAPPAWPPRAPVYQPPARPTAPPAASPATPSQPAWPTVPPAAFAVPAAQSVWEESSVGVLSRPGSGVQACVSCGLPLSATARFCRRCGSRQG